MWGIKNPAHHLGHHLYEFSPLHFKGKMYRNGNWYQNLFFTGNKPRETARLRSQTGNTHTHTQRSDIHRGCLRKVLMWLHNSAQSPKTYQMIIYHRNLWKHDVPDIWCWSIPLWNKDYRNGGRQNDKLMIKIIIIKKKKKNNPFKPAVSSLLKL